MEVTEVQILLYKKQNYVQICVDQELTQVTKVIYHQNRDITEDFCCIWFDDIDLLSFCTVYDVVSVTAETTRLTISASNVLEWDEFIDDLLYLIHNVSPNVSINVIDGGELFVPEVADYYICEPIYELVS